MVSPVGRNTITFAKEKGSLPAWRLITTGTNLLIDQEKFQAFYQKALPESLEQGLLLWKKKRKLLPHWDLLLASDEVGRGPLAGPVVAASLITCLGDRRQRKFLHSFEVLDSKMMNPLEREDFLRELEGPGLAGLKAQICSRPPEFIDQVNILEASLWAMRESAYQCLENAAEGARVLWLVDGNQSPLRMTDNSRESVGQFHELLGRRKISLEIMTVVKGDEKSRLIGAASVQAKVFRDQVMNELSHEFPHYGWETNAGYATQTHRAGIALHGPTPHHRQSFLKNFLT